MRGVRRATPKTTTRRQRRSLCHATVLTKRGMIGEVVDSVGGMTSKVVDEIVARVEDALLVDDMDQGAAAIGVVLTAAHVVVSDVMIRPVLLALVVEGLATAPGRSAGMSDCWRGRWRTGGAATSFTGCSVRILMTVISPVARRRAVCETGRWPTSMWIA